MQIFIFGAARTKSTLSKNDTQLVLEKLIKGQRVLDWTIHGLNSAGISNDQISFVGGFQIEQIINLYPDLHYTINPKWEETHVIGSLRYVMKSWRGGDIMLMYADTIFRPHVFQKILRSTDPVTIGIDSQWRNRITNSQLVYEAEKVVINNGIIEKVGRRSILPNQASAQFSGLTLIKRNVVEKINRILNDTDQSNVSDQDSLTDLLRIIKNEWKIQLSTLNHSGNWSELDTHADLARFVFGTKAETLERIKPFVKHSKICDQIHFSLGKWEEKESSIIERIQKKFTGKKLIIRSSSLEEDSWDSSQAGAFLSVANINADHETELKEAIEKVINGFQQNGFGRYNTNNQVLVQPFISDVAMSGVAFSKHLENGTPYYLVNYDDESKRTDTVTSGNISESKSITIYKQTKTQPADKRISRIIEALEELENITGYSSLDIEFVLTDKDELYVVQVRPITTHTGISEVLDFQTRIDEAKAKINSRLRKYPHIYGETTVLADMPDWNPAEMIGIRPNPLAVSLYQYLITDSTWRIARGKMGYHNPSPENLLFCIGGHPYIDVRNSFNNLIPDGLSPELCEKLIHHYINRLKENPHLHDKVEFEIVITCYTPDIDDHTQRLKESGFANDEINELKTKLRKLTEDAIVGKYLPVNELIRQTESLNPRRELLLSNGYKKEEIPTIVQTLLDDCIELGTIPFSILARYGFVASSMMRGLVARNVVTEEQRNEFMNSIETVASNLVEKMDGVLAGTTPREEFLKEFGHLRPGSYDITSYSYREKPEYYFPSVKNDKKNITEENKEGSSAYSFDKQTMQKIEQEIHSMGMSFSVEQLLGFLKEATAAREYAKFQFTKNLDAVLHLIAGWGNRFGFSRKDLSYLFIDDILKLNKFTMARDHILYLKQKIQEGKTWHEEANKIETPQMITSTQDLDVIIHNVAEPNYVTSKMITAPVCNLSKVTDKSELTGKIVLTKGADPGYDWIFLHQIEGLITKYGGAASHMTIRCAEFGLPAAIGCGEEWYNRLEDAETIELNCAIKQIRVLG